MHSKKWVLKMTNKVHVIESVYKEQFENEINTFCSLFNVFATQTHVTSANGVLIYTAVLFFKVEEIKNEK